MTPSAGNTARLAARKSLFVAPARTTGRPFQDVSTTKSMKPLLQYSCRTAPCGSSSWSTEGNHRLCVNTTQRRRAPPGPRVTTTLETSHGSAYSSSPKRRVPVGR